MVPVIPTLRITCLPRLAEWVILDSVERPVSMSKVDSNGERLLSSLALPFCLQVLCNSQQVGKEKVGKSFPLHHLTRVCLHLCLPLAKSQLGLRTSGTPMSQVGLPCLSGDPVNASVSCPTPLTPKSSLSACFSFLALSLRTLKKQ